MNTTIINKELHEKKLAAIIEYAKKNFILGETHGINHWNRVAQNGRDLWVEGVNAKVVDYFAYLHDYCRDNDDYDLRHGPKAAEKIEEIRHTLLDELNDEEFLLLKKAINLHTSTHRTGDKTVDACFDADRLDLTRVGIIPDPQKMATPKGSELARKKQNC